MKLDDFCYINPTEKLERNQLYDFVEMADLIPGNRYVHAKSKEVFNGSYSKFTNKDVLMAKITPCLENGKISQYIGDNKAFGSTEFNIFRAKENISDSDFLYYLISSDYVKDIAVKSMTGACGRQRANTDEIKQIEVGNIDIKIQQKIAKILSNYDDLIENNNKRIKILEDMAQKIYKEWFVDFKYPGHETATFKDTELGKIPSDWEITKVETYYNTSSGGTPSRKEPTYYDKGTINWVKTGELKNTFIIDTEEKITDLAIKKSSAKLFVENTIVLAMYCGMGDISIMSKPMATNQACCVFIPKYDYLDYPFTYLFFNNITKEMTNISFGAAQQNLSQEVIKAYIVKFPNKKTIVDFSYKVKPIFEQIKNLLFRNNTLKQIRDLLLPRLMSGEIDVESLEIA